MTNSPPAFLDRHVHINDIDYALLEPLTDYRSCHDGTPLEARILYTCRPVSTMQGAENTTDGRKEEEEDDDELIVKIKVQVPSPPDPSSANAGANNTNSNKASSSSSNSSETAVEFPPGPSTTTAAEIEALERFRGAAIPCAPHLMGFAQTVQKHEGCPLPGGYITYTLMNRLPGQTLYDLSYWTLPVEERATISTAFLNALKMIRALGIQHEDRALRNIMWDIQQQKCSIIDFELWSQHRPVEKAEAEAEADTNPNTLVEDAEYAGREAAAAAAAVAATTAEDTKELQRWGLARDPRPPGQWWEIWFATEKQ